jgi:FHA domain
VSEQEVSARGDHVHVPGLFPVPGDGVLARRGDLILLCSLEDSQAADDLLDLLEQTAAAGGDGRQFTDAIADALEWAAGSPSVLAFGPSDSGLAITVGGGAWADLTTADGTARVEAGHPRMLLRGMVRSAVSGVRGGLSPADVGVANTDRFSRLDAGTVRAGGLSYYQDGSAHRRPAPGSLPAEGVAGLGGRKPKRQATEISGQPAPAGDIAHPAEPDSGQVPAGRSAAPSTPGQATAAWAGPAAPDEAFAQERQATELWSAPPGPPGPQPLAGSQGEMPSAGAGRGTADDLESKVTAPPERYEAASVAPAPAESAHGLDPAHGEPFEAVLLLDAGSASGIDVPARDPLAKVKDLPPGSSSYVSVGPIVQGVYCKNGHFDDPEALFCAICGISMNQQTLVPRPGERPPLGVLLLDDGSVFQLDTDYVIGREPSLDAGVAEGTSRPLRISDDTGIVSRVHVRVHLEGWRVLVTDLGSANGTRVLLPGQAGDHMLVPQVPVVLATGSQVDLGGRGFRYESHRGR